MPGLYTAINNTFLKEVINRLSVKSNLRSNAEFKVFMNKLKLGELVDDNPLNLVYGDSITTLEEITTSYDFSDTFFSPYVKSKVSSMKKAIFLFTIEKDSSLEYVVLLKNKILCLKENQLAKASFDKKGLKYVDQILGTRV